KSHDPGFAHPSRGLGSIQESRFSSQTNPQLTRVATYCSRQSHDSFETPPSVVPDSQPPPTPTVNVETDKSSNEAASQSAQAPQSPSVEEVYPPKHHLSSQSPCIRSSD